MHLLVQQAEHHFCVECAAADAFETERWLTLARKRKTAPCRFPELRCAFPTFSLCSFGSFASKSAEAAYPRRFRITSKADLNSPPRSTKRMATPFYLSKLVGTWTTTTS